MVCAMLLPLVVVVAATAVLVHTTISSVRIQKHMPSRSCIMQGHEPYATLLFDATIRSAEWRGHITLAS